MPRPTTAGRARLLATTLLVLAGCTSPPPPPPSASTVPDLADLPRLRDFSAMRASSNNVDLDSNDDSWRPLPGETVVLADLAGPGIVSHIWLTVAANEYGWPRLLRLRVYYDGSPHPSVDAPVGDFFGVGHGFEREVESLVIRDSSSGRSRNSYWPMPFKKSCRITITNEGRRRVSNLYYHVDWQKVPSLAPDTAYFHALYRQAVPATMGAPYTVLDVRGRGHYVGTVLSVVQNQPGWFGEGDDFFYVDGNKTALIQGTGTEDYFNDAWSLRVATGPYAGVPVAEGTGLGSRMTAYRWHLVDPVPFHTALRFDIEHKGWTYNPDGSVRSAFEERADLFSTVAFWYQDGVAADLPEPPYGAARLPHGNATQVEVEQHVADVTVSGGAKAVDKEVFWSKDVLRFDAKGPGSSMTVPFDVPTDGTYELVAQVAHSPDYGVYHVLLDGKRPEVRDLEHEAGANEPRDVPIDAYYTETIVAEDHLIGWPTLTAGRHTLTFVCDGRNTASSNYHLGIDTLILARVAGGAPASTSNDAQAERARTLRRIGERAALASGDLDTLTSALSGTDAELREAALWSFGQLRAAAAPAQTAIVAALADPSPVARGLAALALRDLGPLARPSVDALVTALRDSDTGVRMAAADAITRQGHDAQPAFEALLAAARVPDEHPHVQRSVANALGAIGPDAKSAVPALRELAKIPRVRWAAEAAIKKIER
ncbi:MAG: DUF2961 domain-containing protein [Vicinamibacterales bacterium]